MERALAVVEAAEETKDLVREAGELAAGVDAEVVLLYATTADEFERRLDAIASIPNYTGEYTPLAEQAAEGVEQFVEGIGREVFADVDVEYETVGVLGDQEEQILAVAEEYDCDHVFLSGERRSPAGKALFGDRTQRVILDFDGAVTVVTY